MSNLESKLKDYVNIIPETETYSILPVLRWEYSEKEYRSLSISESVKITKNISIKLLAEQISHDIKDMLREYSLRDADLELIIMGRPWLSVDEFDLDRFNNREKLDYHFDKVLEKKLSAWSKSFSEKDSSEKVSDLKIYLYKDIIMDKYGESLYDKNNNLIGYKINIGINQNKYISVKTYYNENNLLCNKVSIRDFDVNKLEFKPYILKEWVDTKTNFGFIREYNKKKIFLWSQ